MIIMLDKAQREIVGDIGIRCITSVRAQYSQKCKGERWKTDEGTVAKHRDTPYGAFGKSLLSLLAQLEVLSGRLYYAKKSLTWGAK